MRRSEEVKRQRAVLEARLAELLVAVRHREDIAIEKAADEMDNVQLAAERELAISHLHMESSLLRSVTAALLRIKEGSYGLCLNCEELISPKRLQALPWAAYCVPCQEAVDRGVIENVALDSELQLSEVA